MRAEWRAWPSAPSCDRPPMDLASAAMKTMLRSARRGTTHACLAVLVGGSLISLAGCGVGTYHIPNVPPVVKQPPDKSNSLLDDEPAEEKKSEDSKAEDEKK